MTPISRAEWVWLAVAILCGAALRLGNLSQVAVEHFDEAVYASNLLFPPEQGGEYPFRQLYAPPLLPAAIEWTTIFGQMILGDVPAWWPMLPSLVAGLVTIPSLWWIARRWFSPRAGIIAALLIAFHEFHAAYCRTALTDIPLTLFVLWAVHWFWIALQTGRTRDAVIAGVFTSLAWWTKYNGWLPLAIVGSGGVLWQISTPRAERNWLRLGRIWSIGAATAFVLWLPVLWDCQKISGYAAVAANHSQYLNGFAKWGANLLRGESSIDEFVDWDSFHELGLCILMLLFITSSRHSCRVEPQVNWLGLSLLNVWFWGLFIATPLYFPYPRLWLPWMISAWLMMVGGAYLSLSWTHQRLRCLMLAVSKIAAIGCLTMLVIQGFYEDKNFSSLPTSWESRSASLNIAREIRTKIADLSAPLFVHSEPAIWFHLRQQGQSAVITDGLKFLNQPLPRSAYLVIGPQAERDPQFKMEWQAVEAKLQLVEEFSFQPSRIVLLDSFSPRELAKHPERRTLTVKLYRLRS